MTGYKTYEYVWLDGYKPESSMRSKIGPLMDHQLSKRRAEVLIAY